MTKKWLIVPVLLLTACASRTMFVHETKSQTEQYRDEVECKALAQLGSGDGFGYLHDSIKRDLYIKCLKSRDYREATAR